MKTDYDADFKLLVHQNYLNSPYRDDASLQMRPDIDPEYLEHVKLGLEEHDLQVVVDEVLALGLSAEQFSKVEFVGEVNACLRPVVGGNTPHTCSIYRVELTRRNDVKAYLEVLVDWVGRIHPHHLGRRVTISDIVYHRAQISLCYTTWRQKKEVITTASRFDALLTLASYSRIKPRS